MELRGTPPILQVHGTQRTIHGIPWHYLELCGTPWHSMELHETLGDELGDPGKGFPQVARDFPKSFP